MKLTSKLENLEKNKPRNITGICLLATTMALLFIGFGIYAKKTGLDIKKRIKGIIRFNLEMGENRDPEAPQENNQGEIYPQLPEKDIVIENLEKFLQEEPSM